MTTFPEWPSDVPPPSTRSDDARSHTALIWITASIVGVILYALLCWIHISRGGPETSSYKAGQMLPLAVGSAGFVGLIVQLAAQQRWPRWVPPVIVATGAVILAACWYFLTHVLEDLAEDIRAERSGEADYELIAPEKAGDWTRAHGKASEAREELLRDRMRQMPQMSDVDLVVADYRKPGELLVFVGVNASGEGLEELRDSAEDSLENLMAGAGATDVEEVDAGDLGGSMACSIDFRDAPGGLVLCAWADASTVGQVFVTETDIDKAAEITRAFRDHATQR